MPIKSVFAGYHKISGERVMKVFNPVGMFSAYVVENGDTPYSGQTVTAGEIQQEPLEGVFDSPLPKEEPVDFVPDTPEMQESVQMMIDANEEILND